MNTKKFTDLAIIAAFMALLCLPGAVILIFTLRDAVSGTGRAAEATAAVPSPHRRVQSLLQCAHNLIMIRTIKGVKRKNVLFGRERWAYWAGGNSLDQYLTTELLTEKDLLRLKTILEERQSFCRLHGMRYIFIIVPNKDTVYPEFLPGWLRKVKGKSNLDQIVDYLRAHSSVEIIDMRGPLLRARSIRPVFSRVDSHWNDFGGYVCYRELMKLLAESFPGMRPAGPEDYRFVTEMTAGGDFAAILGITGMRVEDLKMVPLRPRKTRKSAATDPFYARHLSYKVKYTGSLEVMETGERGLPRAVMFRDSMSMALLPHLSEHISRMFLFWVEYSIDPYDFNPLVILHERPDIVITEIAERKLLEIRDNAGEVKLAHRRR
jgi:alginate O-acetyltransferase complex protein AlgJ